MIDRFQHDRYQLRKKVLKLFGGAYSIYDSNGNLVLYADLKAFRLKEDIRIYTEPEKLNEVLAIKAHQIVDFSAAYSVFDVLENKKVGALKRRGWKSMLRDEWIIMDGNDQDVGKIREDSMLLALIRRFLLNLIPQRFHAEVAEAPVARFKQHFNPFIFKMDIDFTEDRSQKLDRRLGIAAAVLLSAIEGRQR